MCRTPLHSSGPVGDSHSVPFSPAQSARTPANPHIFSFHRHYSMKLCPCKAPGADALRRPRPHASPAFARRRGKIAAKRPLSAPAAAPATIFAAIGIMRHGKNAAAFYKRRRAPRRNLPQAPPSRTSACAPATLVHLCPPDLRTLPHIIRVLPTKNVQTARRSLHVYWRCHPDSDRGMRVLQTLALPLGYGTKI